VILLGEWFRRRQYRIFSFSLDALALGILYLTLWAASQLYGLIAIELAFAGMLLVTAATAAFALWQDAEVLAMFALIGGFATPALLSVGKNLEIELFSYLVVLDLATLILSFLRAWRRLLLLGIIGTAILYFAWYGEYYSPSQFDSTLTFAIVFFVIFASAPMASARGSYSKRDSVVLFATTLLNALASLCAFALLLEHISPIETSWAMFAIAATYGALAAALQRHEYRAGSILPQLHLSLAVAFVAIAIAFGFESGWITFFWLLEGAVLIGIGFGRNLAFLRWLGLAAIALTIAKLFSYDVWRLERGFRIVSFIALGILLLAVSFVYQQDWLSLSSNRSGRSSSDS
jgi:uncharacterized membrane protein